MRKIIIILLLCTFSIALNAMKRAIIKDSTYITYYRLINDAERWFFLKKNVDSSLHYYDKAFKQYDFLFIRDIMNVAQISFFAKKK